MTVNRNINFFVCLLFILPALFGLNLLTGSVRIPLAEIWCILTGGQASRETWHFIVMESRLPTALTSVLCGSALAVCGLLLQTLFRNPLAGPSIFGITNGAGLGVAIVMLFMGGSISAGLLHLSGFIAIMLGAFTGAMAVTAVIFLFSTFVRNGVILLIVGIMVGYLSSSVVVLLNYFATEEGVRSYMLWGMGNFSGVSMAHMPFFASVILTGLLATLLLVKPLNALLLGELYAESLGIDTRRLRNLLLLATGLLCAVTTAFCGPVSFIGLAVPHMARLLLRSENQRRLLPATMLMGGAVALLCNLICHLPFNGSLIPLNAVTPLVGAPIIIYVIIRK